MYLCHFSVDDFIVLERILHTNNLDTTMTLMVTCLTGKQ